MTDVIRTNGRPRRQRIGTLQTQLDVYRALILHDIKSRFFGNGTGYIVTILWPSAHIAILIGIFVFTGRIAPYGDSSLLYISTGVFPYIVWNYISRLTMLGAASNKAFLQYPIVKPLDIIFARQALEIVSSSIILIWLLVFLYACGVSIVPAHPEQAAYAVLSAALLGLGFGMIGSIIVMIFPLFNVIYVGILIICWITCGVVINIEQLPESVGYYFSWNPLLHSIEWLRAAYYPNFNPHLLDKTYVIFVGAIALALGLILERPLRVFTMR